MAPFRANSLASHIRTMTPVGVLVDGDTPEGIADLCGNAYEWTTSAWGPNVGVPEYGYPYTTADGREDLALNPNWRRVIRGGAWYFDSVLSQPAHRYDFPPAGWADVPAIGLRVVAEGHGGGHDGG
jgi:iron(II)-dependent oxidoreductase